MIGELIIALIITFGLNAQFKYEGSRREYIEAEKAQRQELAQTLEQAYYDSLTRHYDSLDIK